MEKSLAFKFTDFYEALTEIEKSHLQNENSFVVIISKRKGEKVMVEYQTAPKSITAQVAANKKVPLISLFDLSW